MTSTDCNIFVCEIPEWMNHLLRGLGQSSQKYYFFNFILVVIILRDTFSWCFYVVVFVLVNFILELVLTMVYICCGSFLVWLWTPKTWMNSSAKYSSTEQHCNSISLGFFNLFFMGKFCLSSDTHWCNRHIWLKLLSWNLTKCDVLYEIQGERKFWKLY